LQQGSWNEPSNCMQDATARFLRQPAPGPADPSRAISAPRARLGQCGRVAISWRSSEQKSHRLYDRTTPSAIIIGAAAVTLLPPPTPLPMRQKTVAVDSPVEGGGFEPSVPRKAPDTDALKGRCSVPLAIGTQTGFADRRLCAGCSRRRPGRGPECMGAGGATQPSDLRRRVDRGLDRARPHPDSALSDWNNDEIGESRRI
jgi:hypothetical protein